MRSTLFVVPAASAVSLLIALSPAARADVVHLADGTKRVGTILESATPDGPLAIATVDGVVEVERAAIASIEDGDGLRQSFADLARATGRDDARRWRALSRRAADKGLFDVALDLADRALRAEPAGGARPTLDAEILLLPIAGTLHSESLTAESTRALALQATASHQPARAALARRRLEEKVAAAGPELPKPIVAALARLLGDHQPAMRLVALAAIAASRDAIFAPAVMEHALRDRDTSAQREALDAIVLLHDPTTGASQRALAPVLKALESGDPKARAAALDALERIGDPHAVASLIRALDSSNGYSGVRANLSVTNQVSYVSDFDTEIATASAIADPIVSVAQDGAVLDVTILGTSERGLTAQERERIGRLLERLTGMRHGGDSKAWKSWLDSKAKSKP